MFNGQDVKSSYRVTLIKKNKTEYVSFAALHNDSTWYGDILYRFSRFYSDANTPRKQLACFWP